MHTATARVGHEDCGVAASLHSGAFENFDSECIPTTGSGAGVAAQDKLNHANSSPASPVGNPGVYLGLSFRAPARECLVSSLLA